MIQLAEVNWDAMFSIPNFPIFAVFSFVTIISVVGCIAGAWQANKKHQREVLLKRDLVDRGYSVDEIERVVKVKPGKS